MEVLQEKAIQRRKFRIFAIVLIFVLPVLVWLVLVLFSEPKCKPLPVNYSIQPYTLINQDGVEYGTDSLKKTHHVVNFIFTTCPGMCKDMTKSFTDLQEKIAEAKDFKLLSITVDPVTDVPAVLKAYGSQYGANFKKWNFTTGEKDKVIEIITKNYKMPYSVDSASKEKFVHTPVFVLVDKDLRVRGFYDLYNDETGMKDKKRILEEMDVLRCEYRGDAVKTVEPAKKAE